MEDYKPVILRGSVQDLKSDMIAVAKQIEVRLKKSLTPLIYLASPYTGNEEENFEKVTIAAGHFVKQGLIIFSPITHFHPIAKKTSLPTGWEFWERLDRAYLSVSSELYVLMLPGWRESKGVTAEIKIAREKGIPISLVRSDDYKVTKA